MVDKRKSYPKNAPGDFYVEDGCCMTCMVPEIYAPNLMGFDESNTHCFVNKQPTDEREVYQIIKAAWAAEVGCIRYGGRDRQVLRRLAEAGVSESCDNKALVRAITPLLRNHVTFECSETLSETEIAGRFKEYILSQNAVSNRYKASKITKDKSGATFSFCWYENDYYPVWFNRIESSSVWHIFHSPEYERLGSRSISLLIDEWLGDCEIFKAVKWRTNRAWNESLIEWQKTPI